MNFFNRMRDTDPYDWNGLRENAPQQTGLFQSVLNNNTENLEAYLTRPRKIAQEEIDASLFAAFTLGNDQMTRLIFPYASTSGVEAGKLCLIGGTYINNLDLFNDTALWLKKHGENALKKKDVRNHCLINLSAFNHIDKVTDLLKVSKSTLKNNSAVLDFCKSITQPAARYGSSELLALSLPIAHEYFKNGHKTFFENLLVQTIAIASSLYSSQTGAGRALTTDAHNQSFEWLLNNYESSDFIKLVSYSQNYQLDTEHFIEVLKRIDEKELQKTMASLSQFRHYDKLQQTYEQLLTRRQKEIINTHIGSSEISSATRKM